MTVKLTNGQQKLALLFEGQDGPFAGVVKPAIQDHPSGQLSPHLVEIHWLDCVEVSSFASASGWGQGGSVLTCARNG
jgi:hypothetical protein